MAEVTLEVLIIDENKERITLLKSFMPEYVTTKSAIYGDHAKDIILVGGIDLIIMYADDIKGHGLYMFGWLKKNDLYANIPVILLTKDAFSERSLDFLELGDAEFYEGELDQFRIFQMMSELLEEAEMHEDMEMIRAEQAMLNKEKMSGWVSAGTGEVAQIIAEEKARRAQIAAEPKPWQADSAAMVREILKARAAREQEEDEYTRGMNKAMIFAEAVKSTKVKAAPMYTIRIDDSYKRRQLTKSLERGEKKMREIQKALELAIQAKTHRMEEIRNQQKKILVAGEDTETLKLIKHYLQDFYDVKLVHSGIQAIDYIIIHKVELMIIDYQMSMLGGIMTLQSIRYQPNGKQIPALFLTTQADTEIVQRCIKAGAQGIIPKPVSKEKLLAAVSSRLGQLDE